jgi:two-component system chemotaxis sensor kinase CheA
MPIPTESLQALDDAVSRLAAESMLATAGRDDGMIPSYSLLGEIRELCASEPALCGPVIAVHAELDKLLESARPFDDAVLGRVRRLAEWMPAAVTCVESSQPVPSLEQAAPNPKSAAEPAGVHGAEVAADSLLSLNLDENRELLTEFHAEAVDHLQQIEAALLELEHRPNNQEALSSIFRSFHTIKGNAGFLGLGPMQSLAHEVESLLDLARNGRLVLSSPIITEILASRDALQAHTQQVAVALEKGQLPDRVVPVSHLILAVKRLAAGGSPESRPAAAFTSQPVKIDEAAATALVPAAVPEPMPQAAARAAVPESHAAGASQTVRVNTEKLDSLMDVVGELVIVQSQLIESTRGVGDGGSPLQRNVAQLSRITKELQHTAMALRMIPIKPTFQKMERLARDLARDFGKKVAFSTSGDETELDRTVVEQIGDPLVHMVRNALDHGLEPGADRVAHGKPEEGTLHLSAYHQGSNLVIELQDNGRGIDPEKILAKAKRQGLVPENALPDRNEIFNLIFLPGFSTAEKVTAVSGRGVGTWCAATSRSCAER